jgi:hypothetical protein
LLFSFEKSQKPSFSKGALCASCPSFPFKWRGDLSSSYLISEKSSGKGKLLALIKKYEQRLLALLKKKV